MLTLPTTSLRQNKELESVTILRMLLTWCMANMQMLKARAGCHSENMPANRQKRNHAGCTTFTGRSCFFTGKLSLPAAFTCLFFLCVLDTLACCRCSTACADAEQRP